MTQYAESNPDAWIHSNDPVPRNPAVLAEQVVQLAQARRKAAACHKYWCKCGACRVRRFEEARHTARAIAS